MSALSAGVLIATLGALVVLEPAGWPLWIVLAIGVSMIIEAIAQHRVVRALLNMTVLLALATSLILIKDFWRAAIITALLAFLILFLVQNLRELRRA